MQHTYRSLLALRLATVGLALGLLACESAPIDSRPTTAFELRVAPLSLAGVKDARYWLIITNASGDTVIDRRNLTSSQYGDGAGALSYVAPCDASGTGTNTVTLVLEDLFATAPTTSPIAQSSYKNPCGFAGDDTTPPTNWDGSSCSQTVQCVANADRPVTFNIVVARDANQGFFDIAVNFEDVFCSAKLDCVDALLHDAEGKRALTAVLGFACTSGADQPTTLYMNDIHVECDGSGKTHRVDPAKGAGQHGPIPLDAPVLFQTASYLGREGLSGVTKCFWNQALGLDLEALGPGCRLHTTGTAGSSPFGAPAWSTPATTIYPVIDWSIPLTDAFGALACGTHPLDGGNGVKTSYTTPSGEQFYHRLVCDDAPLPESATHCTLHVAVDGSDQGLGSQRAPWRTVARALEDAQPGDVICLGPGDFDGAITIVTSGAPGAPIAIEGARGPSGERLSRLLGGVAVAPSTWEEAFELGPNVYRNASFGFGPGQLTVEGRFVPRISPNKNEDWIHASATVPGLWSTLAFAPDQVVQVIQSPSLAVPFWEAVQGVYGFDEALITYLRLADGRDPRTVDVRVARDPVVRILDARHITLRGLVIEGGERGVVVSGDSSQHVLIEDNHIMHGRRRVQVDTGASHVTVRNNLIEMRALTMTPGAWTGGTGMAGAPGDIYRLRSYLYGFFKYVVSPSSTSDDRSLMIETGAHDLLIEGNEVLDGIVGIETRDSQSLDVRDNRFENFSSGCYTLRSGSLEVHFHDNVVVNSNFGVRPQYLTHPGGHRAFVYRNHFQLIENAASRQSQVGQHIYLHADDASSSATTDPEIFIYHNSFTGGSRAFTTPNNSELLGNWMRKLVIVNNLVSSYRPWINEHTDLPEYIGAFDHNWVGGVPRPEYIPQPTWFGAFNVHRVSSYIDAALATDPAARPALTSTGLLGAGVDVSAPFTANGKPWSALPGMGPGYFQGPTPDIGAVQFD